MNIFVKIVSLISAIFQKKPLLHKLYQSQNYLLFTKSQYNATTNTIMMFNY